MVSGVTIPSIQEWHRMTTQMTTLLFVHDVPIRSEQTQRMGESLFANTRTCNRRFDSDSGHLLLKGPHRSFGGSITFGLGLF